MVASSTSEGSRAPERKASTSEHASPNHGSFFISVDTTDGNEGAFGLSFVDNDASLQMTMNEPHSEGES